MERFFQIATEPTFWVSTIIGSLFLTVIGAYLVRLLDVAFFGTSKVIRKTLSAAVSLHRGTGAALQLHRDKWSFWVGTHEGGPALMMAQVISHRIQALCLYLFGCLGLVAAAYFMADGTWTIQGVIIGAAGVAVVTYGVVIHMAADILHNVVEKHERGFAALTTRGTLD